MYLTFPDKFMNHKEYPKQLRNETEESLRFIIQDAKDSIKAFPANPNNGFYEDEIHYAAMELKRREPKCK
jgi:hypothetical protein